MPEHITKENVEEVSFQLDDLNLTALTCGNGLNTPVLCLHGYLDNAASFLPLMQQGELLANKRLIALEWPGHGNSSHRSVGAYYHFIDYVSDLLALFENNNWPAIDIVAHSMGGMVACAFAAAFPEKVKSLTLIDSFGFVCGSEEETTSQLRLGLLSRIKKSKTHRPFTEETAIKARLHVSDLKACHAKLIVQRSLAKVSPVANNKVMKNDLAQLTELFNWRSDSRLRAVSPYRLTPAQSEQLMKDIKCPVLLLYGDKGMTTVVEGIAKYAAYLTSFMAVKITGGHHVHMEQPAQVSVLINEFYHKNDI